MGDTSTEYLKMCDCKEIQESWIAECGDYYVKNGYNIVDILSDMLVAINVLTQIKNQSIWLPHQNQLQQMLDSLPWTLHCRGKDDYIACIEPAGKDAFNHCFAPSPEQVLLELIMLELHGKKWNGEAWVKNEK